MTSLQSDYRACDFEPLTTVEHRFGVEMVERDVAALAVVMSMPITDMSNPFTGAPTLSPLAILLDAAAGRDNHIGCAADEWTVSNELSLELSPAANDDVKGRVTATPVPSIAKVRHQSRCAR
jgi:hypothetical protein